MKQKLIDMTVGEIASTIPQSILLFRSKKIDFCCNGALKLADYVASDPMLLEQIEQLRSKQPQANEWLSRDIAELIDHIVLDFHEPHREILAELQRLARKVESRHAKHPVVPKGLSAFLEKFSDELLDHMEKEEAVLFPILKHDAEARPLMPIQVLSQEHQDHKMGLEELKNLTHDFLLPEDACPTWQALYTNLQDFTEELQEHIHLENNILFRRALDR